MTDAELDIAIRDTAIEQALPVCMLSGALLGLLERLIDVSPWTHRMVLRWLRGHLVRWRADRCSDSRGY
jgi:hypothetical protein